MYYIAGELFILMDSCSFSSTCFTRREKLQHGNERMALVEESLAVGYEDGTMGEAARFTHTHGRCLFTRTSRSSDTNRRIKRYVTGLENLIMI